MTIKGSSSTSTHQSIDRRSSSRADDGARNVQTLILGAGISGVAAAIGFRRAGMDDFVVIERGMKVGGTWFHNRYPGCAVDIPSHVYSFSFAPNPKWSRVYSPQAEIEDYIAGVVDDFGLRDYIRTETELLDARWDDVERRWLITTSRGDYRAQFFVIAAGPLHEPIIPNLPGISTFRGQAFHSSQWPANADIAGRHVVAIGTGASAIQFVPAIAADVDKLTLLQRTPSWVLPKPDWNISESSKERLARFPFLMKALRIFTWALMDIFLTASVRSPRFARTFSVVGRASIRRHIKDSETRKALTPEYAPTCKRLGFSNDYYRALARPNIDLVTSAAAEIREHSVVTADGREIPADTIIYGTGFKTLQHHPVADRITGRSGETLAETWQGDPKAHMGTTISGFPNAYMMFGPNVGTLSGFTMAEAQTNYILGAVKAVSKSRIAALDVTRTAQAAFVEQADKMLNKSTFALGGCESYYLADGRTRVTLPWPGSMYSLTRRLRNFDLESYDQIPLPASSPSTDIDAAGVASKL